MDCDWITLYKRGIEKTIKVNTSFIVASNPKDDFFPEHGKMRDSIPFSEGIMSRLDFNIPFLSDIERNQKIVDQMTLFGGGIDQLEFLKIKARSQIFNLEGKPKLFYS